MGRAIVTITFAVGFVAFLVYRWLATHAKRGWETAERIASAKTFESGTTNIDLHYHAREND